MIRRTVVLMGVGLIVPVIVAACYRDASTRRDDPTSVPASNFITTPESSRTPIASLTATPEEEPSSTLPVGGPPIGEEEDEEAETPEPDDSDSTLPPTLPIPSFTPLGSTFGDSGITPTGDLPTQPVPDALITPTGFAEENLECAHLVQANETLFSIATQYEVTVDEMIAVNPELAANPNALQIGQRLAIPNCVPEGAAVTGTPAATAQPSATLPEGTQTYTVQEGDTLFRIAAQHNTTVEAIVAANPELTSENSIIQPGQVLIIPSEPDRER